MPESTSDSKNGQWTPGKGVWVAVLAALIVLVATFVGTLVLKNPQQSLWNHERDLEIHMGFAEMADRFMPRDEINSRLLSIEQQQERSEARVLASLDEMKNAILRMEEKIDRLRE